VILLPDGFLVKDNVAMDGGVTFTEILNPDTDYTIGKAVMSSLSVRLVNTGLPDTLYTEEFTASIGAFAGVSTNTTSDYESSIKFLSRGELHVYILDAGARVFTKIENSAITSYELSAEASVFVFAGDILYLVASDGTVVDVFRRNKTDDTLTKVSGFSVPAYMQGVIASCAAQNTSLFVSSEHACKSQKSGRTCTVTNYELVPLGVFKAERPTKVKSKYIELQAYDRMRLLDKPAAEYLSILNYPTTVSEVYLYICALCGVAVKSTTFLHSKKTLPFDTFRNKNITCREVIAWVAQVSCTTARMDRNGVCELAEFVSVDHTISQSDQFSIDMAEIETPVIDKLEVYSSYADILAEVGTGDNLYQIVDNPFLYAESQEELTPYAEAIYQKLSAFPAYYPISARCEGNPAVQCGDIIQITDSEGNAKSIPVFAQTITWNGYAKAEYESTGQPKRSDMPAEQRELANLKKEFLRKSDARAEIESYINSEAGEAAIESVVSGKYVAKADLEGELEDYVKSTELEASINSYINSAEGKANITSSLSGTFVTTKDLDSYAKDEDLADFVTKTNLNTSVEQYLNTSEGQASISSAISGTYATKQDVSNATSGLASEVYVTNEITQLSSWTQNNLNSIHSEITLATAVGSGTLGSNVKALLTLVSNPDSSNISLKADKINLEGYVTFTDLSTVGKTEIHGGNIKTGTLSADLIDTTQIKVEEVFTTTSTGTRVPILATGGGYQIVLGNTDTESYSFNPNVEIRADLISMQGVSEGVMLEFDTVGNTVTPLINNNWQIGTDYRRFAGVYANNFNAITLYAESVETYALTLFAKGRATTFDSDGSNLYWTNRYGSTRTVAFMEDL
jgi:hypothetical protein